MGIAMVTPTRTKSGLWKARKAIPADLHAAYGKREEKKTWPAGLSQGQAKAELAAWLAPIEDRINQLRHQATNAPLQLTPRQVKSLAGDWYRAMVAAETPPLAADANWKVDRAAALANLFYEEDDHETGDVRYVPGPQIVYERDALLEDRALQVTEESAAALLSALAELHIALIDRDQRREAGDLSTDPVLAALPAPEFPLAAPARHLKPAAAVSIKSLFEALATTGTLAPQTVTKWRAAIKSFIDFLGHDDAATVTRSNVSAWLGSLISSGLSVKTVKGTYRAAVARVFKVAHGNGQLTENPIEGVEVVGPKAVQTRRKDISDDEAKVILKAAVGPQPAGISERYALALRWVPWITAYTGARVGEITQLRAGDIRQEEGIWVFHITPEAGSVKTGKARSVPVHSDLIARGILQLAKAGDTTPLFYDPSAAKKSAAIQPQAKQLAAKLAKWVRGLGVTGVQQPNHGWRHRWKTQARLHGLDGEARDVLQGHTPAKEGAKYGDGGYPLAALKAEVEKLPRFDIE